MKFLHNGIEVDGIEYSQDYINEQINKKKIEREDFVLMTIEWKPSRGFDGCKEQIARSREDIENLKSRIVDMHVDFGEIAGKHSEVEGLIESEDVTISSVGDFLDKNPDGWTFNHSFLENLFNRLVDSSDADDHQIAKDIDYICQKKH